MTRGATLLLAVVTALSWGAQAGNVDANGDGSGSDSGNANGADGIPLANRLSGYAQMGPASRAMQDDDSANPGMLWVAEGQPAWQAAPPGGAPSCAGCHGAVATAMRGVAARYPAFDGAAGRPLDLEQRINACRTRHQAMPALDWESPELLALTALVARQARGAPIAPDESAATLPFRQQGRAEFEHRRGQLDLSCAQCHDQHWGHHLAGSLIPQGQATAYPVYRLEWQSLGSLQRRLRGCMTAVRSEPYPFGAAELVDLELFLMWRARGLPLESPGVRP